MIHDLIILFVLAYVDSGGTPDSTLEDEAGGFGFEDYDFDFLHSLQTKDELGGLQLGGTPPHVDTGGSRDAA
jgi:hypothetical protein